MEASAVNSLNELSLKKRFWYHWILKYSFAELLGIGAAAVICRLLLVEVSDAITNSPAYVIPLVLGIAGLAEGWIMGYIQWRSLSKLVAHPGKTIWIVTTIIAMIIGWLLVIPPATFFISFFVDFSLEKEYYTFLSTAFIGMLFGGIVGLGQYFVIRRSYKKSLAWILANAFGWMVSFLVVYVSLVIMKDMHNMMINILLMVIACVLSGMIQGVISGLALGSIMSIKKTT